MGMGVLYFYMYPHTPFVSTPNSPPPTDKKKDVLCALKDLEAEIIVGQVEKERFLLFFFF